MRTLALLFCLLTLFSSSYAANETPPAADTTEVAVDPQFGPRRNRDTEEEKHEREQIKALNKERQAKLKADTDKLLELATELKQYVDKTNENILSLDVLKKCEEIEKLAKSVREKMKNAYEMPEEVQRPR